MDYQEIRVFADEVLVGDFITDFDLAVVKIHVSNEIIFFTGWCCCDRDISEISYLKSEQLYVYRLSPEGNGE